MNLQLPFHDKDLAKLPPPDIVETTEFSTLFESRKAAFNAQGPLFLDTQGQPVSAPAVFIQTDTESYWKVPADKNTGLYFVDLPSDPVNRLLAVDTYRELQQIQRINASALAVMPAYATGADLDHLASRYGIHRLILAEETDTQPVVMESDDAFRRRTMLVIEGYARGGSMGWYLFNALSASAVVKDAKVTSPKPCHIVITILSREGDGAASAELVQQVSDYVNSKNNRVLGDVVTVQSADIVHYSLDAHIEFYDGPSSSATLASIKQEFSKYREQSEQIGHIIAQSGIDQALHRPGVYRASVSSPQLPIMISPSQAPFCDAVVINGVTL